VRRAGNAVAARVETAHARINRRHREDKEMTTRRKFLQGAAATGAALGFPAIVRAATPMTFTTPFGFDPTFIDVMNAYSGGYFAKEGIDAKLVGPPGNAAAFQLMVAGQADFSYIASLDFIRAVATKDAPFLAVACLAQRVGFQIVSLKEKPVKTGADLKGKTIGVLSVGGLSELLVQIVMAKGGVKKDEANIVVAGNNPGEVDLIRAGRLDCFICNYPIAVTLRNSGQPLEFIVVDDVQPAAGLSIFCTRETAAKKPELVMGVLRAFKGSVEEILSKPLEPIFERAAKDFDIPRIKNIESLVTVQKEVNKNQWLAEGRENLLRNIPRLWQSGVDGLRSIDIADVKDTTTLYTNKFIDQVMKS
jgi:ABC-type nitrate/sulfonate/bicarbonate transport system substrate-binding protein